MREGEWRREGREKGNDEGGKRWEVVREGGRRERERKESGKGKEGGETTSREGVRVTSIPLFQVTAAVYRGKSQRTQQRRDTVFQISLEEG